MKYLIGGSARCGKTLLAEQLRVALDGPHTLSGDALRHSLKGIMPIKDYLGTDISDEEQYITFFTKHIDYALEQLKSQGEFVYDYIKKYIDAISYESGASLIVDGIDVWPDSVSNLDAPFMAVFLVDTSNDQWRRITEHANQYDWITSRGMNDAQIKAWAGMNARRSEWIKELCVKYNFDCFDVAELGFEQVQALAFERLINMN